MAILTLRIPRIPARLSVGVLLCAALSACMSERPPLDLPNASVITFDGIQAHGPDCASIAIPSHLRDPDLMEHPSIPFGCANYTNLAVQLARPADAVAPRPYAGADGTAAVRGMQIYQAPPASHGPAQGQGSNPSTGMSTTNVGQ